MRVLDGWMGDRWRDRGTGKSLRMKLLEAINPISPGCASVGRPVTTETVFRAYPGVQDLQRESGHHEKQHDQKKADP